MMKLSKKADYGLIALKHLAMRNGAMHDGSSCSAADISEMYKMSTPLMAKVLQKLAKGGLVAARHGSSGGYTLARGASMIRDMGVVRAVWGRRDPDRAGETPWRGALRRLRHWM